jgi:beta-1,4-mannosyltransferase
MVLVNALDRLFYKVQELKSMSRDFKFPRIQVIVTGKGPQKDHYLGVFDGKNREWAGQISIGTVWLDVDDYPLIVASADLGVCLHFSSSGYDLPMKVVDMFSARLPCLAIDYLCIGELVDDGKNGHLFKGDEELCD